MTAFLAIGIGCRRDTPAAAIVALVEQAREGLEPAEARLFSIDAKRDERGLIEAAGLLDLPLMFLPAEALQHTMPAVATRSARVATAVGVASVAEAAALAGAGVGATLIVPRRASGNVTCAIALASGQSLP